jgi:serine/threonine-protein kinase
MAGKNRPSSGEGSWQDTVVLWGPDSTSTSKAGEEESDTADLAPPVDSRYQERGELGRGGMGTVLRVEDDRLLRQAAMKVLDPQLARSPEHVRAFLEEAQVTAQLEHPSVVPVHDIGPYPGGSCYFTMKLVEGRTLEQHVAERAATLGSPATMHEFLNIFLKLCDALAFAHSRGVLHCDLKPGNLMVGNFGEVYLMDWGLSRLIDVPDPQQRVRLSGMSPRAVLQSGISGTPSYMAPEQARCLAYTERTDIFGLGAILYFLVTGEAPFAADTVEESLSRASIASFVPPEELRSDLAVPPGLSHIIKKAMAREPSERYQQVQALKADVEVFLRGGFHFSTRIFAAGEKLMNEGEPGHAAYLITRGTCVAYKMIDGVRTELRRMGPGSVVGEMALLLERPRTATVEALEELHTVEVTRDMLHVGLGIDTWLGRMVRTLADRFRDLDEQITALRRAQGRSHG